MVEIKEYAPVIIPTLNRYEHLKRCLESLERCTGAEKTDVYVGLDYPPSEKYRDGWEKVDNYLREKEKNNTFHKLLVTRLSKNYGSIDNMSFLTNQVKSSHRTYILSEDDNEFSPNFLEYINKGLTLFYDNEQIQMISGYAYPGLEKLSAGGNAIAFHKAAAWGCAFWFEKEFTYSKVGAEKYRDTILGSWKKAMQLFCKRPISLNSLISMKLRNTTYGDGLMVDCLLLEDKYCVFPKISKVRNWGHDGTGEHCDDGDDTYVSQEIDSEASFDYDELTYLQTMPYELNGGSVLLNAVNRCFFVPFIVLTRYAVYRFFRRDLYFFRFKK